MLGRSGRTNRTFGEHRSADRNAMAVSTSKTKVAKPPAQSLADLAYAAVEEMIVSRRLAPGAMISEGQIGKELKMGRTPIREAIARLRHIGFVEVHPRRGVLVSGVDVIKHLELLEVRRPLEECVVRHAVERATPDELKELQTIARDLAEAAKAGDRIGYFRTKRRLHEVEVNAANNEVLTRTMKALHAQSRRFWYTYEPTDSFLNGAKLHGAIANQVAKRDAVAAMAAVTDLFEFLERLTRSALDRRPRE
jgi:DNA-binding GntR family transcriptional regulator